MTIVVCGILCAPMCSYLQKCGILFSTAPRTLYPTIQQQKNCRQKRVPTSTYVGSGTKQEVTYYSEIPTVVKLGDVNENTTIVGLESSYHGQDAP